MIVARRRGVFCSLYSEYKFFPTFSRYEVRFRLFSDVFIIVFGLLMIFRLVKYTVKTYCDLLDNEIILPSSRIIFEQTVVEAEGTG